MVQVEVPTNITWRRPQWTTAETLCESQDEDNTENNINSYNMSSQKSRVADFYFNLDLEFTRYLF